MKDLRPGTRIHAYKGPNKGRNGTIIGPGSTRDRLLIRWDETSTGSGSAITFAAPPATTKPQTLFQ